MGIILDRNAIERIAHQHLSREFMSILPLPGSEARHPSDDCCENSPGAGTVADPTFFPPITRSLQLRHDWWKNHGIVKHEDDHYTYYYAIGYLVKPYLIAEIGTYYGGSLMLMAQGARQAWADEGNIQMARAVTVNGFDNEQYVSGCVEWSRQAFIYEDFMTNLMVADTQKVYVTKAKGGAGLPLHMIELFHVDGDHTYQSALHDLELASETMVPAPRGVILVDDTGWARPVKDAMEDFVARSGEWVIQHQLPILKGMTILTRK